MYNYKTGGARSLKRLFTDITGMEKSILVQSICFLTLNIPNTTANIIKPAI